MDLFHAPSHWSTHPDDLEEARDEFTEAISVLTGRPYDPNKLVKPILYLRDSTLIHLVEYPSGKGEYYFWNTISDNIWKVRQPKYLDAILQSLKVNNGKDMDLISLDPYKGMTSVEQVKAYGNRGFVQGVEVASDCKD
ncbi:MAG: hypothetical protein LQ341_005294 [Variospora aurantia]|nr:MAG: hypothetical protein LQ341_005294 [Variospora aurantia]